MHFRALQENKKFKNPMPQTQLNSISKMKSKQLKEHAHRNDELQGELDAKKTRFKSFNCHA